MADYYEQKELWDRNLTEQERERIELVRRILPDDVHTILDAGCGNGAISNFLDNYEITGIDRSAEALKYFKHENVRGSLDKLPFEDNAFDIVICSDVLEHLPEDVYTQTVKELKRVSCRYLLIISPNREDLEANQCKCKKCGTTFHMNWHIRSLSAEDIITKFRDDFSPLTYTYFGEKWSSEPYQKYKHLRLSGKGYKHWENAVCPLCQTRQNALTSNEDEADLLLNNQLDGFSNVSTEVMLLLVKSEIKQTLFDFDAFDDDKLYLLAKENLTHTEFVSRQFIDASNELFVKNKSEFYPQMSYLLRDDCSGWGDVTAIQQEACCCYEKTGELEEKYGHALCYFPYIQNTQKLFVEYFDIKSDDVLLVSLYTCDQSYVQLGTLAFKGSETKKTMVFYLPDCFVPVNEGIVIELTIENKAQPTYPIPFFNLYFEHNKDIRTSIDLGKVSFLNQSYHLKAFDLQNHNRVAVLPSNALVYNKKFKAFFWNRNKFFEYLQDFEELAKESNPVDYTELIQSINGFGDKLQQYEGNLFAIQKDVYAVSNTLEQQGKCLTEQENVLNEQETLLKQQATSLLETREAAFTVSNTVDEFLKGYQNKLWKRILKKILHKRTSVAQKTSSKKQGKHLVVITPDVKIDRRTVQMCQSLIKNCNIRCTIIAALKEKDDFVTERLQVKRINPAKTKKYTVPKGMWKDELNVDLEEFYWLHYQYLYMAMAEDADYIMCCDLPVLPAATYVAKLKNIPLIYDAHELYPEQAIFEESKRIFYSKVEQAFIQYPDLVITVNISIANEMAKRYGIKEPQVILNSLDCSETFDINKKYNYFREKLAISEQQKIVLFQGGYSPNRNLDLLVKSAKYLQNENIVLVLMGFGEFQKELEKIAKRDKTLNKKVFFFPAVEQSVLLEYSASADVGIIPYPHIDLNSYYCTPNKLFEFIQAGLPMIANDSPELNRFIKDNKIGTSQKIENAEDIAQMIENYFKQSINYKEELEKVRRIINWSTEEDKFIGMMKEVI